MTYEDAFYFYIMLASGYRDEYDSFLTKRLEEENELGEILIDLSFCTNDLAQTLTLLGEYIKNKTINHSEVLDRVKAFWYNNLQTDKSKFREWNTFIRKCFSVLRAFDVLYYDKEIAWYDMYVFDVCVDSHYYMLDQDDVYNLTLEYLGKGDWEEMFNKCCKKCNTSKRRVDSAKYPFVIALIVLGAIALASCFVLLAVTLNNLGA